MLPTEQSFRIFVERLVEIETEYTYKYMDVIHYRTEDGEVITEDFIHIMTRALFESMFEVVRHKNDEGEGTPLYGYA